MSSNVQNKNIRLATISMLAALSVVLIAFVRIPLIPAAPFLVYDMADVPVLIGTLIFGTIPGLLVLLVACLIQAIAFSADGWVGFVMHFVASGVMVIIVGEIYRRVKNWKGLIIGMVLSTIAMTAVMIPMNLWLTVYFLGQPREVVEAMLLPAIIPFNLLKAGLNSAISVVLFKLLTPFLRNLRLVS